MLRGKLVAVGSRFLGVAAKQSGSTTKNAVTEGAQNSLGGGFGSWFGARLLLPSLNSCVLQTNRLSCCAKVDLPPPREIVVEYHEKPENMDHFIELADGLENANPELMVLGNPEEVLPREGSFEVTTGQHVLFSMLQAKRLPRVDEILLALEQLPTEALSCEIESNDKAATA